MDLKSNKLSTLISYARLVLSVVLYYVALAYCATVGYFTGEHLSNSLYNMAINIGLTGVKWIWPSLVYAVLAFLIGITIVIVLFWRVFLKDPKGAPFTQLTSAHFMRHLISFSAIGFFGGFAWTSVDQIMSLINVIARLQK